ncbi:MAG: DUF4031 domain-containing protein [Actinomycetota bacterium]|jgi:hypothetical protein|nr:DUF4031 domain-containing protein [Actinomycetota bacterium]
MILVDQAIWPHKGKRWAHLVSDSSYEELHRFAERLGLARGMFQGDHYDVHHDLREQAITLGAKPVDFRVLARALNNAGLRCR